MFSVTAESARSFLPSPVVLPTQARAEAFALAWCLKHGGRAEVRCRFQVVCSFRYDLLSRQVNRSPAEEQR